MREDKRTAKELIAKLPLAVAFLLLGGAVFAGIYWLVGRL